MESQLVSMARALTVGVAVPRRARRALTVAGMVWSVGVQALATRAKGLAPHLPAHNNTLASGKVEVQTNTHVFGKPDDLVDCA